MTLTLDLTPSQEAVLRAGADRAGKSLESYLVEQALSSSADLPGGIIGLFADEPELMDEVLADIMRSRAHDKFRADD